MARKRSMRGKNFDVRFAVNNCGGGRSIVRFARKNFLAGDL
jgi:hypothetical protein